MYHVIIYIYIYIYILNHLFQFLNRTKGFSLFWVDKMSCSTPRTKDFMRIEDSNLDVEFITEKNRINPDTSYDMSQTICLFKKYLTRFQQNKRKSNMEESEVFKRRTSRPLLPPKFGSNLNRPAYLLEQALLPVLRYIFFFIC